LSGNGYLNLTNCTDGSENQEWNYLEPAQHAQSIRRYAPRKVGSSGLARETSLHQPFEPSFPQPARGSLQKSRKVDPLLRSESENFENPPRASG
jgi:hypothetical protein